MTLSLRPYQVEGARFLASRKNALLADEMGLGKSAQAIAACDELLADDVLVVCPASVCENWRREFRRFSMTGIRPSVVSYDMVARNGPIRGGRWDVLILDEAHYLKTPTSKRTRVILGGGIEAAHTFLLTGTPMLNHPAELWPALHALAPETIRSKKGVPLSYWQFVQKYCKTRDNGFGIQIVGAKNHAALNEALDGFMLRRLKKDVAKDLPPFSMEPLYVDGKIEHTDESLAQSWAAAEMAAGDEFHPEPLATLRRLTGLAKVPACIEWIKDFLESGRQLVVFAYHREVIERLAEATPAEVIAGGTHMKERQRIIDSFQAGRDKLVIGQIQAAGTGITLTAASDVLFVESDWVPANIQQAAQRVHRIGQTEPCLVRIATLAGSIDEDIERAVIRKARDIEKILDPV